MADRGSRRSGNTRCQTGAVRFVIYGAGGVGGVVGARLHQAGYDVTLIARGSHYQEMVDHGLTVQDPDGEQRLRLSVVDHPGRVDWGPDDACLVAVQSQHTPGVAADLALTAPIDTPVVCLQNGVGNEPELLRRFPRVYAVPVACPTARLRPGVVTAFCAPVTGILDVGCYPGGVDAVATEVSSAFAESGFESRAVDDVARWKWRKLVTNLGNAVEAVCGPEARPGPIGQRATAEGEACLAAAGIDAASAEEDRTRRGDLLHRHPVDGASRPGGSTWQSLTRQSLTRQGSTGQGLTRQGLTRRGGTVETDYLNGEVVLLGRLHGVPTPVNTLLQRLVHHLLATGGRAGSIPPEEFEAMLDAAAGPG